MSYNLQRYIPRRIAVDLQYSLNNFPITALLGPRQCGKSTLAKHIVDGRANTLYLDLERPSDLRKLDDPEFFFQINQDKLICIDEVQMGPELFPILRVAVDDNRIAGRFLILGSASQDLIRQSSETLAGRIHFLELSPFNYDELVAARYTDSILMWSRGGFPEAILSDSEKYSFQWRVDFIRSFLERDIPQFGFSIPAITMRRFWTMIAHYHGQLLNSSKLAQSLGVSNPTIRKYIDIMEQTFMVNILPPFITNLKKRLIKSPKIYIRDSGILHALLEIENSEDLLGHPIAGASWEGWCIEQILSLMSDWRASFYRTASGEEIDLILQRGQKLLAFEFKLSVAPKVSRGFANTLELLQPNYVWIVAPVQEGYQKSRNVKVASIRELLEDLSLYRT
jgi:predicted AAA+ superfamily ATPase